jgi:hypothetical protein
LRSIVTAQKFKKVRFAPQHGESVQNVAFVENLYVYEKDVFVDSPAHRAAYYLGYIYILYHKNA